MAKILIIDDDRQICSVLGVFLRRQGYEVATAADGNEGLKAAASLQPDLIVCDLDLPGLDGQGVIAALRQDRRHGEEVPVIFLSGCTDRAQIRRSMNLGGDDFITKPAPFPEILEAVKSRLARSRRRRRELDEQLEQAAEVFSGIIHDLNRRSGSEIRWLAEPDADRADQKNLILQKVRRSLDAINPVPGANPPVPPPASVLVKNNRRRQFLKLSEVKALIACGEYSDIYWGAGQHLMFRKPLKQWEAELPADQFVRVHRQAIVNLAFLDFTGKDSNGKLQVHLLEFKQAIPVSLRETAEFNRRLKSFRLRSAAH